MPTESLPERLTHQKIAARELGGLLFSESVYSAELEMAKHAHGPASFGIVLSGGYTETLGRRTREGKPLTTIFHPQGEAHAVTFHQQRVRIFRFEFGEAWSARMCDFLRLFDAPAESNGGLLAFLAMRLYREYQHPDQWSPLAVEGLSLEIIAELARAQEQASAEKKPRWLERIRERLSEPLAETISLAELAAEVGVHPVHLSREFRRRFQCTIGEYVRRLRIERACVELSATDASLSAIALSAGFYDQSHFSNAFKKVTGLTPAAWRASCRKD